MASQRAAAIKDEAAEKDDALMTGEKPVTSSGRDLSYILSSAAPRSAIPPETAPAQDKNYTAGEFAEDFSRKAAGSAVGGTLSIPQGTEEGVKGLLRRQISGESYMIPQAQWADKAMGWLMDATGFRSYAEQASDRQKAMIAFDRFATGIKIPGAAGLAAYGRDVQKDIESEISEEGKKRIQESTPSGNILKGELDFGSNPTLSGYALQAAGVFGSLAPTVATVLITKSPSAAMAVGGTQAASEGSQSARDYIGGLSDKQLSEVSPYYNTLIKNDVPAEEARTIVTDKAAETSAVLQGMVAAVGSRVTSKLLTGAYNDILSRVGGSRAGSSVAGAGFSLLEEGTQETAEGIASDIGIRSQIANKEIGEGSAANFVLGALGGAPVGAISGAMATKPEEPPAPPATTPPAAPTTAEAQQPPVAPVGEPAATAETTTVSQPSTTVVSGEQTTAATVPPVGTAVTSPVTDQAVTPVTAAAAVPPTTVAPAEPETPGVISTASLKQQLADVDAEAAARAAEQALATPELPEGLAPETSVTENFGPDDTRFAAFESATDKELYVLGKLNRRPAKTPELTQTANALTSKISQSLGITPEEVAQRAEATRVATQNGLASVESGAVYKVPTGITTPPVSPLMSLASQQIAAKFNLPEGETVSIPEAPVDPVRTKIASVIKDAFGVDVVWANLPKGGKVKTNKGRQLVAINGARIAGTNAILLDANNYSFLNTLGHELTHVLETQYPQLYQQLITLAKAKVSKKFQTQLRKEVSSDAEFNSELVAEMVGEQSTDPKFWQEVFDAAGDQTAAQNFLDALNRIIDRILSALQGYQPMVVKSRKDALAVRQAAQQAFQQWITARQQAAQQVAADQQAAVQAAAAVTRPAARVNPFLVGTQYDETAAQQEPAPTPQPPKVPPSRQAQVNIGQKGRRFVTFAADLDKDLFELGAKLKKAAKTLSKSDRESADARLVRFMAVTGLPRAEMIDVAKNYRDAVVKAAGAVQEDGTYEAPATNIGERRAVEERKIEERREPQRERADEQVREVRQDREQPPVEQVEGAEAGGRDRAAEGRPQPEEVAAEPAKQIPLFSRKELSEEQTKADKYMEENDILPYVPSTVEVPTGILFSVKREGKYGNHPVLGIPVNANGTVTLYYHTTNEMARKTSQDKVLRAKEGGTRIYLTNESSAKEVLDNPGNIEQELGGANVLVQIDPDLLQIDQEFESGRKDFFIAVAEGESFRGRMRMVKLFTQNAPRTKGLSPDATISSVTKGVTDAIAEFQQMSPAERRVALREAKAVLKQSHNVGTLLGVNGKLEKTNTGGYGLNNYGGKDVMSMGLGMASAQKINDQQKLTTCPQSAICEALCLGETSGQNQLYGGVGQYRSGPRLSQYLKTEALVVHPREFAIALYSEIDRFRKDGIKNDYQPTVRLNVTTDFAPKVFESIINAFPEVMFYDYTKLDSSPIAENHHITYSSTGVSQVVNGKTVVNPHTNWNRMVRKLNGGFNVAMAFTSRTAMPKFIVDEKSGQTFQVWNGDNYDARFLDPKREDGIGMIVGLTNKDRTTKPEESARAHNGFFVNYDPAVDGDTVIIRDQDLINSVGNDMPLNLEGLRPVSAAQFETTAEPAVTEAATQEGEPIQFSRVRSETNADGKPIASTPEFIQNFWNWFGDSKLVDRRGRPKVMYHGTIPPTVGSEEFIDQGISVFRRGTGGAIFVSPDARVANTYAGPGGSVYPLYVRAENPFDFENPDHVKRVMDIWESNNVGIRETREQAIAKGKWQAIENVEIQDAIKQAGFDSYYVQETGAKNLALYEPSQLKSAVGNVGEFSPESPDIQFSRVRQGRKYWLPEFGRLNRLMRGVQNEVLASSRAQKAVAAQGGVLTDSTDIESAMHRMYGRAGNRIDRFRKDVVDPIIKRAVDNNVDLADVELYLYANHAKEANRRIASINPQMPDGGSGMTNAEADQVMATLRQDMAQFVRIKSIADEIQNITKMTQTALVNGDIVSPADVAAWNATYNYYVPLKTFEQADELGRSTGNGRFDLANAFSKRRLGRSSKAGAILENILADYEEAVVAVERNNVRKAWLQFILANKDSELWQVNKPVMQRAFYKNPVEEVRYRLTIQKDAETLPVRVGGEVYHMVIKDPEILEELQMTSVLSQFPDTIKSILGGMNKFGRTLSKLWTVLSPPFVVINTARDVQTSLINTGIEQGFWSSAKLLATLPKAAYTVWRAERNNAWTGDLKQYYDMYRADGGKTGALDLKQIEDRHRNLITSYKMAKASIGKPLTYHRLSMRYLQNVHDFMMDINGAIEGAARVAAYKVAMENGKSRIEATNIAKEITVNFNRRGKWTPVLSGLYLFFNPAVQGAKRTVDAVFSKRGAVVGSGLVTLGYFIAEMAASAVGDDDEPYWDKPSMRATKLKNLVFFGPNGETYNVPLPYGFGFFVNLGYAIRDLKNGVDPFKVGAFMRDSASLHFSPLGSMDNMATFLSPTLIDPAMVLITGEKETGLPLMPEDFTGVTPNSERYWNNTRDTLTQRITSWMYEATGGGTGGEMPVDFSPEQVNYVWSFATGGAGAFVRDLINTFDAMANTGTASATEQNLIPVLKAVHRQPDGRYDSSAFYENVKEADEAARDFKKIMESESEITDEQLAYADSIAGLAQMAKFADKTKRAISNLRQQDLDIQEDESLTREQKYEIRKDIAEQIRQAQVDFNISFYQELRARKEAEEAEGETED
jgi:hypothetical protein